MASSKENPEIIVGDAESAVVSMASDMEVGGLDWRGRVVEKKPKFALKIFLEHKYVFFIYNVLFRVDLRTVRSAPTVIAKNC
jgi:hypothetical protein